MTVTDLPDNRESALAVLEAPKKSHANIETLVERNIVNPLDRRAELIASQFIPGAVCATYYSALGAVCASLSSENHPYIAGLVGFLALSLAIPSLHLGSICLYERLTR